MSIRIVREQPSAFAENAMAEYASVPIAFEVQRVLDIARALDGETFVLSERELSTPRTKDYDATSSENPASWPRRFDLSTWTFFGAYADHVDGGRVDGARMGSAAMVIGSTEIDLLEGRRDLGLLWDIRVAPNARRSGIGSALLAAVESRIREQGGSSIAVETQDINVPACRFYQRHGFRLREAHAGAYLEFPDEMRLLWQKELGARDKTGAS